MILSCCRTLLTLSLLISVLWIQPVGAQPALVKDIRPGSAGFGPFDLTNVNGALYFTANDGITGEELWRLAP